MSSVLAASACGGQAVEDENGSGGAAGSGGTSPDGGGGATSTGGGPESGGASESGGAPATGGLGGADNGCDLSAVDCPDDSPGCTCPGVFEDCPFGSVQCDVDTDGNPRNCVCGDDEIVPQDCDYALQYRCAPPGAQHVWATDCTCDPALPTDDEPCRYFQEMYDAAGYDYVCSMSTFDMEPGEWGKYSCGCL